jgi:hypothetical protein
MNDSEMFEFLRANQDNFLNLPVEKIIERFVYLTSIQDKSCEYDHRRLDADMVILMHDAARMHNRPELRKIADRFSDLLKNSYGRSIISI